MTDTDFQCTYTPLEKPVRITEQDWPEDTVPLVSISCITYNHVNFIRDAIEGFLMQETTFPVEILIHDDASTDGTAYIVREYEAKYPQLIKAVCQTANQYSQGNRPRQILWPLQRGKYIALCEGDDYWLVCYKLEKQVQFLHANKNASFVFHNAIVSDERQGKSRLLSDNAVDSWYKLEDLIKNNFIATASKVVRKSACQNIEIPGSVKAGDWIGHFLAAQSGPFYYFHDVMSVYRLHDNGVWTSMNGSDRLYGEISVLEYAQEILDKKYHDEFKRSIERRKSSYSFSMRFKKKLMRLRKILNN